MESPAAVALGPAVLCIRHSGQTIFEAAYRGYSPSQRVALASASKWVSAVLLLRLLNARGPEALDEPVLHLLPGWGNGDPQKSGISLRMLLSHTSGLPGSNLLVTDQSLSLKDCAMAIGELPLSYAPGSNFLYGECGLQVAGAVVEVIGGAGIHELLTSRICQPLGLNSLSFADGLGQVPRNPQLGAGLFCSAPEYSRLLQALLDSLSAGEGQGFIRRDLIAAMFSDQTSGIPLPFAYTPYIYIKAMAKSRYGLGCWRERVDPGSGELIVAGSQGRWGASPWINLRQGHCGMLLVQDDYLRVTPLYLKLHELLDGFPG